MNKNNTKFLIFEIIFCLFTINSLSSIVSSLKSLQSSVIQALFLVVYLVLFLFFLILTIKNDQARRKKKDEAKPNILIKINYWTIAGIILLIIAYVGYIGYFIIRGPVYKTLPEVKCETTGQCSNFDCKGYFSGFGCDSDGVSHCNQETKKCGCNLRCM